MIALLLKETFFNMYICHVQQVGQKSSLKESNDIHFIDSK